MKLVDKYVASFFRLGSPCSFPGCDELRARYLKELRGSTSTNGCAACKRMSLVSKYKNIIKSRIERNK